MSRSIFAAPHFNDEAAAYAYVEARIWAKCTLFAPAKKVSAQTSCTAL